MLDYRVAAGRTPPQRSSLPQFGDTTIHVASQLIVYPLLPQASPTDRHGCGRRGGAR